MKKLLTLILILFIANTAANAAVLSADKIKKDYCNNSTGVSVPNTEGVQERMKVNADKILDIVCSDDTKNVILFFPPYSALYWADSMNQGLFEEYMMVKEYSTPVLNVISMGQTDVICTSNYESKDVTKDDTGLWED